MQTLEPRSGVAKGGANGQLPISFGDLPILTFIKESNKMFPSLKFLYMSHNKISSFESINELSSTPSVSVLQNSIYPSNQNESETAKQETIARLPNLTH
ncbi:unnamed protein product [Rotaria socialis]|uniref:Uncharacterized protein n=1 Tax=Rotaria socialis TaxID=392032 RepID=A0A821FW79_9BILA|nr:unnamed protein product [Rotaria socialis]CAF4514930.1 unnamed protein product [Rotaria socialis]CAF4659791.1 unnamed protein product [Rotaria socialis]